jgi:hypothetical protein
VCFQTLFVKNYTIDLQLDREPRRYVGGHDLARTRSDGTSTVGRLQAAGSKEKLGTDRRNPTILRKSEPLVNSNLFCFAFQADRYICTLKFFMFILFGSTTLLTGMTSISLHMQLSLSSQSHGSVSQREQLFFHYGSNSTPYICGYLQM